MYTVDDKDQVVVIETFPQSSVGAPVPILLADEFRTIIAYYMQETDDIDARDESEAISIVTFKRCYAHIFGPPNDEVFHGHPLASRGLGPYSAFLIKDSSWLRQLEKMNSVHPYHSPKLFENYKHFVISFHDSTFECIAVDYEFQIVKEPFSKVIEIMSDKILKK